jgi:hypothetical protein
VQGSAATRHGARVTVRVAGTSYALGSNGQTAPAPAPGPSSRPGPSRLPLHSGRRFTVWLALVGCSAAIIAMAVVIHLAVADHDRTVTTVSQAVGGGDTAGIRAAQRVRTDLAEMDLVITRELLRPTPGLVGLPDAYNDRHRDLVADLDTAAQGVTLGAAETVPLANLQYERAHYHALVGNAVVASQAHDRALLLQTAARAREVMAGPRGMLDQAMALDKANTHALNQSYDGYKASSGDSARRLDMASNVLIVALLAAQVACALCFRRLLNFGLLAAAGVAIGLLGFTGIRLSSSSTHLTTARERALDPVHELAQARATVIVARQAEARWLLAQGDGGAQARAEDEFRAAVSQLFRLPDGGAPAQVIDVARSGAAPQGAGGYLGRTLTTPDLTATTGRANQIALVAFGDYLAAHEQLLASSAGSAPSGLDRFAAGDDKADGPFARLVAAVDESRTRTGEDFAADVGAAAHALRGVQLINAGAAVAMLALVGLGMQRRLREYRR